ncbi:hypothetical protein [Cryobacterium luteum]|uniref:Uncharacterized protein n=1 Tax=Cryobacterium luteum TaxID=1424661 RepID=A0A5F0D1L2_9MICO|nr:hypothetical protein [Cryobacterium luteum]TFB84245.1 hypothetical protein E3O10_16415 [Cryobacterium luteum]
MTTDTARPADEAPVSIKTEYLPDDVIAVLGDQNATPGLVLKAIVGTIIQTAPDALIVITGDFVQSVQDNFDARGVKVTYGTKRGANFVSAKTMRNAEGGATIYVPSGLICGSDDESQEQLAWRVSYVLGMAAHEAVHALNHDQAEDSEAVFSEMKITTASEVYYATEAGTIVEEYRAQTSAELAFPYPGSFIENLGDDLDHFGGEVDQARQNVPSDVPEAARIQGTACTNLWKAMAFAAAESRVRGVELPASVAENARWQHYAAPLWEAWVAVLAQLPPGNELAGLDRLTVVTRQLMKLLAESERLAGVHRSWDDGGAYMHWVTPAGKTHI